MKKPDLVLFDLDGTLVDSLPDLAFSMDAMLEQLGLPTRGIDKAREWIGNGAEKLVKRALTDDMNGEPETGLFHRAFSLFSEIYVSNTSNRSRIYPGVRECLQYLKDNNCQIACVTNKRARFTEPLLRSLGLYNDFSIIISGDTLPKKKPDPMPLLHAAQTLNVAPENTLMVGDSRNDVQAARAAGLPVVAVRYGYNHGENIEDSKPDRVVDSLAEMPGLFS